MARRKKRNKARNQKRQSLPVSQTQQSVAQERDWDYHNEIIRTSYESNQLHTKDGHYARSWNDRCQNLSAEDLERIAHTPLFTSAIEQIANAICRLEWTVTPPEVTEGNQEVCEVIKSCFKRPNVEKNDTYAKFLHAIVRSILVHNVSPIEKQLGDPEGQPFWLWDVSPRKIRLNPKWNPQNDGVTPRYFCVKKEGQKTVLQPIMSENMFIIQSKTHSEDNQPPSPVQVAYWTMRRWLGIDDYQARTVEKGIRDYLISLEDCQSADKLKAFRDYWKNEVEGSGRMPVLGGKVSVHKIGAKSDDELFHAYKNHLANVIALCFGLKQQDLNVDQQSGQNRATAEVHDATTFFNAIYPLASCIFGHFDVHAVDYYFPGYSIEITTKEPGAKKVKKKEAREDFSAGLISLNEARTRAGEEPVDNGNLFFIGNRLWNLEEGKEFASQPATEPPQEEEQ